MQARIDQSQPLFFKPDQNVDPDASWASSTFIQSHTNSSAWTNGTFPGHHSNGAFGTTNNGAFGTTMQALSSLEPPPDWKGQVAFEHGNQRVPCFFPGSSTAQQASLCPSQSIHRQPSWTSLAESGAHRLPSIPEHGAQRTPLNPEQGAQGTQGGGLRLYVMPPSSATQQSLTQTPRAQASSHQHHLTEAGEQTLGGCPALPAQAVMKFHMPETDPRIDPYFIQSFVENNCGVL